MKPIAPPNYTQIPNQILDAMASMHESEFRILIAICRQTFGWHRDSDILSLSQIMRMTGLSRPAVSTGIAAALDRGLLERTKVTSKVGAESWSYRLLVHGPDPDPEPGNSDTQVNDLPSQATDEGPGNSVTRVGNSVTRDQVNELRGGRKLSYEGVGNSVSTQKKELKKPLKKDLKETSSSSVFLSLTNAGFTPDQAGMIERSILAGHVERLIDWVNDHQHGEDGVRNPYALAVSSIEGGHLPFMSDDDTAELAAEQQKRDEAPRQPRAPVTHVFSDPPRPEDQTDFAKYSDFAAMFVQLRDRMTMPTPATSRNPYRTAGPDV